MKNFLFLTLFCAFYSNASDFKLILNNKDASPLSTSSSDDWIDLLLIESNNNSTTVYSDTTQKAPKKIGGVVMYKQIEHLVKTDNNISKRPTPILIEEVKINKRKQLSEQVVEEYKQSNAR